ncbi:exported hypothetical protein [Enterobacterales bacterium 8AC]|nr:exported hypothetical protein [Enterobacterales bacterium 8AC]
MLNHLMLSLLSSSTAIAVNLCTSKLVQECKVNPLFAQQLSAKYEILSLTGGGGRALGLKAKG